MWTRHTTCFVIPSVGRKVTTLTRVAFLIASTMFANLACTGSEGDIAALEEGAEGKEDRNRRRLGQTLEIEVDLSSRGEYDQPSDEDLRAGWKEDEENGGYRLAKTYVARTVPWRASTFDYFLKLEEDGTFSISFSGGDSDYGFDAALKLPKKDGKFIALDVPYELSAGGGDYAGGAWSGTATVKITVKP